MNDTHEQFRIDDFQTLIGHHYLMGMYCIQAMETCEASETLKPLAGIFGQMAAQNARNIDLYKKIAERTNTRRQKMMRRVWKMVSPVLLALLLIVPASLAQDMTPEATAVVEAPSVPDVVVVDTGSETPPVIIQQPLRIPDWAWFLLALVVAGMGGGVLFLLYTAIDRAAKQYPPEAGRELFKGAADSAERAWGEVEKYVKGTATPFDDIPVTVLDPFLDQLVARLRARGEETSGDTQPLG